MERKIIFVYNTGDASVTIAIAENPSYRARTGTVMIGTETFTVTQEGRTDCSFEIDPENTTASVNGAHRLHRGGRQAGADHAARLRAVDLALLPAGEGQRG